MGLIHPNLKYQMNLRVLRRYNKKITSLIESASHAVLYQFSTETNSWAKLNIEGPIFLYKKSTLSYTGLFILNRLSLSNFELELMNVVVNEVDQYIMIQHDDHIYGVWMHDSIERETIYAYLRKAIEIAEKPPTPEMDVPPGFEDRSDQSNQQLLDMLAKPMDRGDTQVEAVMREAIPGYLANKGTKLMDRYTFESRIVQLLQVLCVYIG